MSLILCQSLIAVCTISNVQCPMSIGCCRMTWLIRFFFCFDFLQFSVSRIVDFLLQFRFPAPGSSRTKLTLTSFCVCLCVFSPALQFIFITDFILFRLSTDLHRSNWLHTYNWLHAIAAINSPLGSRIGNASSSGIRNISLCKRPPRARTHTHTHSANPFEFNNSISQVGIIYSIFQSMVE